MSIFTGTGVALATPCNDKGIVFSEVEKLLNYVISGGVNALIALGTTGEASTLDNEKKESFVRFVRKYSSLPLIVGAGGNNTRATAEYCIEAERWGADALLIVTPFYNKCTQQGAIEHYRYIAERVSHPIIVYNVPGRTGFNLLPETMAQIAQIKNIAGIKEASGNMVQIERCLRCADTDVFCGDDALTVPSMSMGAKGVISVAANVAPNLVSRMTDMAKCGNLLKAGTLQLKLLPLIDALFSEVNPIPVRAALELIGIDPGEPRLPMTNISEHNKLLLKAAMEELKLL